MGDSIQDAIDERNGRPTVPPVVSSGPRVIPVTTAEDGSFVPRMYAYWSNAWVDGQTAVVFAGHEDGHARFFRVTLGSGSVERLGSLVSYTGTTEGWSWDVNGWITLIDGPRLRRVHPFKGEDRIIFDVTDTHPGCDLWQAHSSSDGTVHSATVRQVSAGAYPKIGTIVKRPGAVNYFPAQGVLDESQVSRNGQYVVIKEDDDNRIVTIETGDIRTLRDADGALGHSDCGPDFVVGEDNQIGACVYVDLRTLERRTLFSTWNMGYVSVRGGRCLHSSDTHLNLVALDGSGITPLIEHGGGTDYDSRVKASLSPCGRVATYMANNTVYLLVL